MVPQASEKCGLQSPNHQTSVAARATASIRKRCKHLLRTLIAILKGISTMREKFSNIFSAHHAALGWTHRMKSIAIILFAILLFTGSACTKVYVSVHQPTSSSKLTGTNCKLKRELVNQHQETSVWCWAASAHTVIEYLRNEPNNPITQCDLVQAVYGSQLASEWSKEHPSDSTPPDTLTCCLPMKETELKPTKHDVSMAQNFCYQNGWPEFIFATEKFRTTSNWVMYDWSKPYPHGLRWDEIVEEICADRPMISVILYAREIGGGGHAVVIGGYSELQDGSQWVHVYDPSHNTEEGDSYIWPYDIYLGNPGVFTHVRDYKNISVQ
jgi:Peptidase_C39 like family